MTEPVVAAAIVLVLGVGAQYLGNLLKLPSIVLLLGAGFAAGPIFGWIDPDALMGDLLPPFVAIGVALIVFEGGLGLEARQVGAHGKVVTRLVTLGVGITWLLAAGAARYVLGWEWEIALLLGAILTVSGPTVVLPLLRHVRPARAVGAVARWEGILVDPVGAVLAVLVFESLAHSGAVLGKGLLLTVVVGLGIGLLAAAVVVLLESRLWVPDYLAGAVALTTVLGAFAAAESVQAESGLVAVTAMSIALANQKRANVHHILDFKEQLSILLLGSLFILLAARVQGDAVWGLLLSWKPWAFLAILVLVIRPLAVLASAWRSELSLREAAWLAGLAPRGIVAAAVASLFALRLEDVGHPLAASLVPMVFFVILGSVVLYGFAAKPWAKFLGVAGAEAEGVVLVGANQVSRTVAEALEADGVRALIIDDDRQALAAARIDGREATKAKIHDAHVVDQLDLTGIGKVWAISARPETNALAVVRFAEEFGRARAFEVAVEQSGTEPEGRVLWDGVAYRVLRERIQQGWQIRRTPLTHQFTFSDYKSQHPDALWLWLRTDQGRIMTFFDGSLPKPQASDTLASLVPPAQKPANDS